MEATHQASGYTNGSGLRARPALAAHAAMAGDAAARVDWDALRSASHACCCPARPAVIALIPPAPGRPHRTDLLLCMHHFRGSRSVLAASAASVLDMQGKLIDPATPAYLPPTPACLVAD
ncbi:MAG TPA: hypothetical protein VF843_02800 [Streptosporangiaceae bacterium]